MGIRPTKQEGKTKYINTQHKLSFSTMSSLVHPLVLDFLHEHKCQVPLKKFNGDKWTNKDIMEKESVH